MLSLFFRFSYLPDSGQLGVPRGAFPLDSLLGFWSQPCSPRGLDGHWSEVSGALAWKQQFKQIPLSECVVLRYQRF